jgi:pimeloyl-ACP methyl ester carboxylesterase
MLIQSGDVALSVGVTGDGPLVILMHGWPELGLSWRHQIAPLAHAGWQVAVPDMRGYGASDKPAAIEAYSLDVLADDMAAIAAHLGARRWVAIGHDWGAPLAWRCALRFPDQVAAVFCLSVPHSGPPPAPYMDIIDRRFPDQFFYMRYFQAPGVAEAEFAAADMRQALKQIFHMGSGEGVLTRSRRRVPRSSTMLASMDQPPEAPLPFMPDDELALYAAAFSAGGMQGPLNWYRNFERSAEEARAYGDNIIRQPSGFLAGEHEMVLATGPGQLERMRELTADLRAEISLPGAGHWIQQERPEQVNAALVSFLDGVRKQGRLLAST